MDIADWILLLGGMWLGAVAMLAGLFLFVQHKEDEP